MALWQDRDSLDDMREFMRLMEAFAAPVAELPEEPPVPVTSPDDGRNAILGELRDVALRLRAHAEMTATGDHALGIEEGMMRAAEMIERVIRDHGESIVP